MAFKVYKKTLNWILIGFETQEKLAKKLIPFQTSMVKNPMNTYGYSKIFII